MKSNFTFFSIIDRLGGAEQLIMKLASKYKKESTICFFSKQNTSVWIDQGFKVIYCNGSFWKFLKICASEKFNLIFSTNLMMNAILGAFRTIGVLKTNKLICRESTSVFGRFSGIKLWKYKLAYWIGYRNIDLVVCQTELMKKRLIEKIPYLPKRTKIETIPNPFEFPTTDLVNMDIEIQDNTIVAAGRLIPEKGFDILIKSFTKLLKTNSNMNLIILGEGSERGNLENLIQELNLNNKVILKGQVENVYPYFKQATLCVVSSIREGFPNVLLQMMSQNDKVVSTLCAGGIENIRGLELAEINDIDSLYKAIKKSLDSSDLDGIRELFNAELKSRSIEDFVKEIKGYL